MSSPFSHLHADLARNLQDYAPCSSLKRLGLVLTLNSAHAVILIRLQQWLAAHRLPTFVVSKILFWFFKIEVSRSAAIGPGLRLPHPMGIIIGPNTTIGKNCDLYADVRLVLSHGCKQGPELADGVFLGDGAKVVGHVRVGENATVGVSSVVTRDVRPHVTVAGVPARELKSKPPELKAVA
jgi:serine O-acetyltransferase